MTSLTPEYDKFKALEEAINDASLRVYGQPADPMAVVDLEALVLANHNKNMIKGWDERIYAYIMSNRTRKALKRKASPRQTARRQQWLNEVRRVQ
jgi:hypothetical protein